jgi:hypothetical protein
MKIRGGIGGFRMYLIPLELWVGMKNYLGKMCVVILGRK